MLDIILDIGIIKETSSNITKGSEWYKDNKHWLEDVSNSSNQQQSKYQNCMRKQSSDTYQPYQLDFHAVQSKIILWCATFKHIKSYTGTRTCQYLLCHQCYQYLVKKQDHFKNVRPLFYWRLLSGTHNNFSNEYYNFFDVYSNIIL